MSELPTREEITKDGHSLTPSWERHEREAAILEAYAEGRLIDREAAHPMFRQGGLSGAWYPADEDDEPDGWLWIGDNDAE